MPFLAGGTLRASSLSEALPRARRRRLARALARAVGRAHARGIVHRDLKPENVLFDARGRPLVADLGLAKHFRDDVEGASREPGADSVGRRFRGTAGYMRRPSRCRDAQSVGPPADVFALGAILYECLAGRPRIPGLGPGHARPLRRRARTGTPGVDARYQGPGASDLAGTLARPVAATRRRPRAPRRDRLVPEAPADRRARARAARPRPRRRRAAGARGPLGAGRRRLAREPVARRSVAVSRGDARAGRARRPGSRPIALPPRGARASSRRGRAGGRELPRGRARLRAARTRPARPPRVPRRPRATSPARSTSTTGCRRRGPGVPGLSGRASPRRRASRSRAPTARWPWLRARPRRGSRAPSRGRRAILRERSRTRGRPSRSTRATRRLTPLSRTRSATRATGGARSPRSRPRSRSLPRTLTRCSSAACRRAGSRTRTRPRPRPTPIESSRALRGPTSRSACELGFAASAATTRAPSPT